MILVDEPKDHHIEMTMPLKHNFLFLLFFRRSKQLPNPVILAVGKLAKENIS